MWTPNFGVNYFALMTLTQTSARTYLCLCYIYLMKFYYGHSPIVWVSACRCLVRICLAAYFHLKQALFIYSGSAQKQIRSAWVHKQTGKIFRRLWSVQTYTLRNSSGTQKVNVYWYFFEQRGIFGESDHNLSHILCGGARFLTHFMP